MPRAYSTTLLCLGSLAAVLWSYIATLRVQTSLSPQGCRMSWMSPSYILQPEFNASWTPLAHRYSLWLYREVGWDSNQIHGHQPVLFIPGNAGSFHQVRSIASSAVRQYYTSPHQVSPEIRATSLKPIDMFAVDFNEDLSAFHGPTMDAQTRFTSDAVAYILSRYPPNTTIIILGHSMGGIVATSLLPSDSIAAIITMSTPHTLPPARLDQRIDRIYDMNKAVLKNDPTPIMSLCGGATDMMIPSESCILEDGDSPYRRTVFSSALEGAWTGVGHREMVWCHQVRWRVARAALELQNAEVKQATVLDRWLRDGTRLPPRNSLAPSSSVPMDQYRYLQEGERLILDKPNGNAVYLLPLNLDASKFTLYVSKGSISSVSPHKPLPLEVSVLLCDQAASNGNTECGLLAPSVLRLIPSPIAGKTFPIAGEGSDESEGIVLFEAELSSIRRQGQWIAVQLDRAEGVGWVVAHTASESTATHPVSTTDLLSGGVTLELPKNENMHAVLELPNLLNHALLVYRLTTSTNESCIDPHLSPLLVHRSPRSEVHYFALSHRHSNEILLHTHSAGPFVDSGVPPHGIVLDFLSTGCPLEDIRLEIAWVQTVGRWASRFFPSVVCWAVGVVSVMMFDFWGQSDSDGIPIITPTIAQSLTLFVRKRLLVLSTASFLIGCVPLPADVLLGNHGIPPLAPIGPLLMLMSTGLVGCSIVLLSLFLWPLKLVSKRFHNNSRHEVITGATLISMALILLAVFLFIPWQVAFLGCWTIQFMTCASTPEHISKAASESNQASTSETLRNSETSSLNANNNLNQHILLFMTWLLPLAAPVLVVWIRTLLTAGFTTPFDGDHFILNVAPFLVLVDFNSRTTGTTLFTRTRFEKFVSVRWSFLVVAGVAFIFGSRKAYMVFDTARLSVAALVVLRIGPSYWRRWSRSKL